MGTAGRDRLDLVPEDMEAYLGEPLRGCIVGMVALCLTLKPENQSESTYFTETLEPLFRRLIDDCLENCDGDMVEVVYRWVKVQQELEGKDADLSFGAPSPLSCMMAWLTLRGIGERDESHRRKSEAEPEAARVFPGRALSSYLSSYVGSEHTSEAGVAASDITSRPGSRSGITSRPGSRSGLPSQPCSKESTQDMGRRQMRALEAAFEELRRKYAALEEGLSKTSLGKQILQAATDGDQLALHKALAAAGLGKSDSLDAGDGARNSARRLSAPSTMSCRPESAVSTRPQSAQSTHSERPQSASEAEAETAESMGAVLLALRERGIMSASAAFAHFGPGEDGSIDAQQLLKEISGLGVLSLSHASRLVDVLDRLGTGRICYQDFRKKIASFLATSQDFHSSLSEEEVYAIMARINMRLQTQNIAVSEAFRDCDVNGNGILECKEFVHGFRSLRLGLSVKEAAQVFKALSVDASPAATPTQTLTPAGGGANAIRSLSRSQSQSKSATLKPSPESPASSSLSSTCKLERASQRDGSQRDGNALHRGFVSLTALEAAVVRGAQQSRLRDAALAAFARLRSASFARLVDALELGAIDAALRDYAEPPEHQYMYYSGFTAMANDVEPSISSAEIGRLWCVLEKQDDIEEPAVDVAELVRWMFPVDLTLFSQTSPAGFLQTGGITRQSTLRDLLPKPHTPNLKLEAKAPTGILSSKRWTSTSLVVNH